MKPIKVLHIIGSGSIGGAENFVYQLANYQQCRDEGIIPAIFFVKSTGPFYDKADKKGLVDYDNKVSLQ
jgi:hypothetical protein